MSLLPSLGNGETDTDFTVKGSPSLHLSCVCVCDNDIFRMLKGLTIFIIHFLFCWGVYFLYFTFVMCHVGYVGSVFLGWLQVEFVLLAWTEVQVEFELLAQFFYNYDKRKLLLRRVREYS